MFALQDRASAFFAGHPASCRPIRPTVMRVLPPANGGNLHDQALQFSLERRNVPFIFSTLRTLFLAPKLQLARFQSAPHSSPHGDNVTFAFPVTSALFVRSLARVQYSTPLLSIACALFCENGGVGAKFGLHLDCQQSLLISGGRAPLGTLQDLRLYKCASRLSGGNARRVANGSFVRPGHRQGGIS